MLMIQKNFKGLAIIVLVNLFAFLIHANFGSQSLNSVVDLQTSYAINTVVTLSICIGLLFLNEIFESQIGFIYLALSVLKMMVLYGLLNPTNQDGEVIKADAFAFLVPFGLNLLMELFFAVKLLKINDLVNSLKKE